MERDKREDLVFPISKETFFEKVLPKIRNLPPAKKSSGEWYKKLMRLVDYLNTFETTRVWYLDFYWCWLDDDYGIPTYRRYSLDDGSSFGDYFMSSTYGNGRTLEQNCERMYRNISNWIFDVAKNTSGYPKTEEELELRMAIIGV